MTDYFPTRRTLIKKLGPAAMVSAALCNMVGSRLALASVPSKKKLVLIINRGGADGLSILAPVGDPAFASLRALFLEEALTGFKVDSFFCLHPALQHMARLANNKQALFIHAVGLRFPTRSHFDAQNLLETGGNAPYAEKSGFLNRLLDLFPQSGKAMALSPSMPAILRGSNPAGNYSPHLIEASDTDLYARISAMYQSDEQLHRMWEMGVSARQSGDDARTKVKGNENQLGALASQLITTGIANIAMIETIGWDTHSNQDGRLQLHLSNLDALIDSLRTGLGPVWNDTMILILSEFGRTAVVNGTRGTDHGTGSAAIALGGNLHRTGVIADWPGLKDQQLFEGRDLATTTYLESFISGTISRHFALEPLRVAKHLYPVSWGDLEPANI